MIYTVTLNPAIDKTVEVDKFAVDSVNRVKESRFDIGGKGINVSKVIHVLGGESMCLSIVGGSTGDMISKYLEECNIPTYLIKDKATTRTNTKIVDYVNQTYTDVNEVGGPYEEISYTRLEEYLDNNIKRDDILVLAGSLPKIEDIHQFENEVVIYS